ncbi:MAG: type II toxin-antitoxin system VapC family toxin [Nitrospinae bacterium]|nr:type II toxin-antitoxin system VapC family toxin [Nitrospinota bacterium]
MKYILDTHAWFWAMESPEKIPKRSLDILKNEENFPFGLSTISLWELAKLVEKGRITLSIPLAEWIAQALPPEFIEVIPITPQVAIGSTQLPGPFHTDPADQLIVSTTRSQDAVLITADKQIHKYGHVKTIWK